MAAALLGAGCEPDDDTVEWSTSAPSSEDVHHVRVVADFSVAPARPDTELSTVRSGSLDVGGASVAVFAIDRPAVASACVVEARLRLFIEPASGNAHEELGLYPSHVFDAASKRDGERFGYAGALLDVRPRALFTDAGAGWTEWDVTAVVKRWIGRGVFPSAGSRVPGRGPVVLALREVDNVEPLVTATVGSVEGDAAPHVVLVTREGCSG